MQPNAIATDTGNNPPSTGPILLALKKWENETGVTATTTWRWRRKGWLKTVNICGRVYVTAEAIANFKHRAQSGEFSQEHTTPKRNSGGGL